jgi:dihydroorotase
MIKINNVQQVNGTRVNVEFASVEERQIDGRHLLQLPGLIDPHVHFRTPGFEYKEDWRTAAKAALRGGITTVMDMPNTLPATITHDRLLEKMVLIDTQLSEINIPLRYHLYFGADKKNFDQLHLVIQQAIGLKIFMGASTGELLMDDDSSLHAAFALSAKLNLLVAVHAEDEAMIQQRKKLYAHCTDFSCHSNIRLPEVAAAAVAKAISLSRLYGTRLYILHVSSELEINLIRQAKMEGLPVYAETCPHYLFLSTNDYGRLQGFAQMNPALRMESEQEHLWQAVNDGTIDTIGSDHAPHTIEEKQQPYGCCPSGVPGIETTLPLLYTAYRQGKLSLTKLLELMHGNPQKIFNLKSNHDCILIDVENYRIVDNQKLCTKAKWSPYAGMSLIGWPQFTTLRETCYDLNTF